MNKALKENVKRFAKKRGVSLAQMEKDLGFSERYLSHLDTNNPSIDRVVAMADYLGVSVDALVGYTGNYEDDLQKLLDTTTWLTKEDLVALLVVAEQLRRHFSR